LRVKLESALPLAASSRQNSVMPKSSQRKTSRSRRAPPRRGKAKGTRSFNWTRIPLVLWKLLPVLALGCFALVAFVLDPAAVIRLAWACVSGAFGGYVQLAVAVVLLAATAATVWAFWPDPAPPPRRSASRATAQRKPRAATTNRAATAKPDEAAAPAILTPPPASVIAPSAPAPGAKPRRRARVVNAGASRVAEASMEESGD
jgi:hypothetical protein